MKLPLCANGGCLAKLGGVDLAALLSGPPGREGGGEFAPQDAAPVSLEAGEVLFSADFGPPVGDDPFRAGQVAALHAFSDLYVSGARPTAALVLLALGPDTAPEHARLILEGIYQVLGEEEVQAAGGHTIRGAELLLGLSVIGDIQNPPGRKRNCRAGDLLLISKPLGTGIALRAAYHGLLPPGAMDAIYGTLLVSNKRALWAGRYARALTDITGFGLLGHLSEMLEDFQGARIRLDRLPYLEVIAGLSSTALQSKYTQANLDYARRFHSLDLSCDRIEKLALLSPETNGPVLAAADREQAAILEAGGFIPIGHITDRKAIVVEG
ncbi:MAG: selenide, water dikinase SelD [Spirochaetaceae bacterium]|nr:selenide, water dikinase SelD [Spirochaetaceae bacterium]